MASKLGFGNIIFLGGNVLLGKCIMFPIKLGFCNIQSYGCYFNPLLVVSSTPKVKGK